MNLNVIKWIILAIINIAAIVFIIVIITRVSSRDYTINEPILPLIRKLSRKTECEYDSKGLKTRFECECEVKGKTKEQCNCEAKGNSIEFCEKTK
jgi:hypothetical protein